MVEKAESNDIAHENAVRDAKDRASRERLEGLEQEMQSFESELFELYRLVRIQAELRNIQTLEEQALAEAKPHSEETKREREDERRRRCATRSIKGEVLSGSEHNHESWSDMLSTVMSQIVDENKAQGWDARSRREKEESRLKAAQFATKREEPEQPRTSYSQLERAARAERWYQARRAKRSATLAIKPERSKRSISLVKPTTLEKPRLPQ